MNTCYFDICNVKIALTSVAPLVIKGDSVHFQTTEHQPQMRINIHSQHILQPEGQLLGEGPQRCAYQGEIYITRCLTEGLKQPYAALTYRNNDSNGQLDIQADAWDWATDEYHLWSSLELPYLLLKFRTLILHASYIENDGQGILFTAPSGTGKSTQAELWRKYRNAQVLNGDKAGISIGATPILHGVPFSGTSGICKNKSLPLKAIVVLSQAKENTVRKLSPSEAVVALAPNVFMDKLVPEEWTMAVNLLLDLVAKAPVYSLSCTPDERAVATLEKALNQ